ncbi:MAG: nucleotidyltransferase domain-containing protein [Nanoarchaeota archaeon]|nr:nucleotidyltransferase domain-containing protein [Nanoarchaeota archaeon]MBU0976824.1 nucleotidyltransferase domain-containing protein [Nanoarchaeota archaeon]
MKVKKFDFSVGKEEFRKLKKEVDWFLEVLKFKVNKKYDADVFLGGSFAKGTLALSETYDADIFVRFDWKYENLSDLLENVLKEIIREHRMKMKRMHGSRDYFRVYKDNKLTFEIIPVLMIKRVREARNVTDLSYFHVRYVKKKLNGRMRKELALAKKFFKAQGVYGAESYINGFSGYGLECLIIYYKSFDKMLKELVKVKENGRIVIDLGKFYKKKNEVFFELNESKLHSPVVLIDPTWKERNVLASLSLETFKKFQGVAAAFLKKPSEEFFYKKEFDESELKRNKGEFVHLELETNRQEGDIAGTKMKKFSRLLEELLKEYFEILDREFVYSGEGNKADVYFKLISKKKVIKKGPPLEKKKDASKFIRAHKSVSKRAGFVYAIVKIDFDGKEFLRRWNSSREGMFKKSDMGISKMAVVKV